LREGAALGTFGLMANGLPGAVGEGAQTARLLAVLESVRVLLGEVESVHGTRLTSSALEVRLMVDREIEELRRAQSCSLSEPS
jgi:hypothetical protein